MIKIVAFDLDGTLGDTLPLCIAAFKIALRPYVGRELSDEEVVRTFGLNEEGIIRSVVGEKNCRRALEDFYEIYENLHEKLCPQPFAGTRELLAALREKGVPAALVTGKGKKSCEITLWQFGQENAFEKVLTGSAERNVKAESLRKLMDEYAASADETLYVGDTLSDIVECEKAGVKCLSAAWSLSREQAAVLEARNRGNVFRDFSELSKFLLAQ